MTAVTRLPFPDVSDTTDCDIQREYGLADCAVTWQLNSSDVAETLHGRKTCIVCPLK